MRRVLVWVAAMLAAVVPWVSKPAKSQHNHADGEAAAPARAEPASGGDEDEDEAADEAPAEALRVKRHRDAERLTQLVLAVREASSMPAEADEAEADSDDGDDEGETEADEPEPVAPPAPTEDAVVLMRQLFERGQQAYEDHDYPEAYESFLVAYQTKPAASLLYNAAVCAEKMEDYYGASELFQEYLDSGPPVKADAEIVQQRIARLQEASKEG